MCARMEMVSGGGAADLVPRIGLCFQADHAAVRVRASPAVLGLFLLLTAAVMVWKGVTAQRKIGFKKTDQASLWGVFEVKHQKLLWRCCLEIGENGAVMRIPVMQPAIT